MSDVKIKTGVVFVRNGLWQVEVEKQDYVIQDQFPSHSSLILGLHENRRVIVRLLNSTCAEFLEFT